MHARAAGLAMVVLAGAALPLAAGSEVLGCEQRMLGELGWLDGPGGAVLDLPLPAPAPDTHACTGQIQPGARMTNGCTMNFIFRDGAGQLYLGTAGHCAGGVGSSIGVVGFGEDVAQVVYDGHPGPLDFALARIHPQFRGGVDPTLCHWGGPDGIDSMPHLGTTTHLYGWGTLYNAAAPTRARMGYVQSAGPETITYIGFAQPGDSGSPVVSGEGGKALGIHVASSLAAPAGGVRIDPSQKYATRVDRALQLAEEATGLDLEVLDGHVAFNPLGT